VVVVDEGMTPAPPLCEPEPELVVVVDVVVVVLVVFEPPTPAPPLEASALGAPTQLATSARMAKRVGVFSFP
jgi:hypothetical protein